MNANTNTENELEKAAKAREDAELLAAIEEAERRGRELCIERLKGANPLAVFRMPALPR